MHRANEHDHRGPKVGCPGPSPACGLSCRPSSQPASGTPEQNRPRDEANVTVGQDHRGKVAVDVAAKSAASCSCLPWIVARMWSWTSPSTQWCTAVRRSRTDFRIRRPARSLSICSPVRVAHLGRRVAHRQAGSKGLDGRDVTDFQPVGDGGRAVVHVEPEHVADAVARPSRSAHSKSDSQAKWTEDSGRQTWQDCSSCPYLHDSGRGS